MGEAVGQKMYDMAHNAFTTVRIDGKEVDVRSPARGSCFGQRGSDILVYFRATDAKRCFGKTLSKRMIHHVGHMFLASPVVGHDDWDGAAEENCINPTLKGYRSSCRVEE